MPLIKSRSDEARSKNIEEMIQAGHPPDVAKAAAYANQRKYKKMAEGGMAIEDEMSEPNRGLYELQEESNPEDLLSEIPVNDKMVARALAEKEDGYAMGGMISATPETTVSAPETHFAEAARKAIEERKKKKMINVTKGE